MKYLYFRFLRLAEISGVILLAGCSSADQPGSNRAAPDRHVINKDTPGRVVFPWRTDLSDGRVLADDPTFCPAAVIRRATPSTSSACPPGNYQVWVSVIVEADGSVKEARVVEHSSEDVVDSACVDCVRRWRFQPASLHGKPVATTMTLPFYLNVSKNSRSGASTSDFGAPY